MSEETKENRDCEKDNRPEGSDVDSKDGAPTEIITDIVKGLDANRYATKKTVAQGMLDIALLTSNASQLKYVLQVGPKHEFYMLLVVLISISIVLQVLSTVVGIILSCIFNINHLHHQRKAEILNNISLVFKSLSITVNVIISIFYSIEMDYFVTNENLTQITQTDPTQILESTINP